MTCYRKLYAALVSKIDASLTILDTGDPAQLEKVHDILRNALWEAEEMIIGD